MTYEVGNCQTRSGHVTVWRNVCLFLCLEDYCVTMMKLIRCASVKSQLVHRIWNILHLLGSCPLLVSFDGSSLSIMWSGCLKNTLIIVTVSLRSSCEALSHQNQQPLEPHSQTHPSFHKRQPVLHLDPRNVFSSPDTMMSHFPCSIQTLPRDLDCHTLRL
jgi:hypothetical protein